MSNVISPTATLDDIIFKNKNKEYGAYVLRKTYPKVVTRSLLVGIATVSTLFALSFAYNKIAENSRMLALQGNHLPKEIADNATQLKKMFMPMMLSAAIFRYLIIGALVTVIAAGFLSKKNKY